MDSDFLEAKLKFTVEFCAHEIEKPVKEQFDSLTSLKGKVDQLQYSSGKPDSRAVKDLIRVVGPFLLTVGDTFKPVDAFCGKNANCRECALEKVNFNGIWKRYLSFYLARVRSVEKSSLGCQAFLAHTCKSPVKEKVDGQLSQLKQMVAIFEEALGRIDVRPSKHQMGIWTKEANLIVSQATYASPVRSVCASPSLPARSVSRTRSTV